MDKGVIPGKPTDIILYHGTSSSRASKIVGNISKPAEGFRGTTYFAEDFPTAEYFAFESLAKYTSYQQIPKSMSVIEFRIPKQLIRNTDLFRRSPIGAAEGMPFTDISGGTGFERILSGEGLKKFNDALGQGIISVRRRRL